MPNRAAKACGKTGCRALVRGAGSRCAEHAREREQARGSATARGYGFDWRTLRASHLAAHPTCSHPECGKAATDVDHVNPHRGDDRLRLDAGNLQSLCHSHHSSKTATQDGGFGRRRIEVEIERDGSYTAVEWEPSV